MKKTFLVRGAFLLVVSLMIGARALAAPSACSSVSAERLIRATACDQWATLGSNIYNTNSSNVGIGTNNPTEKLQVIGTMKADRLKIFGMGGQSMILGDLSVNATTPPAGYNFYVNGKSYLWGDTYTRGVLTVSGNVGVGTINPLYKLDVAGSIHGTSYLSSDGTIGITTIINTRNSNNSGACAITVKNGLITATTCQ